MTISLRPHPVSAFTGLILLAVCLFAVFFIGRSYLRETPTSIVRNTSQPATGPTVTEPQTPATGERISDTVPETSPAGTSAEKQSNRGHEQRKERPSKELIASNTVTIDLEKNSLLRSSDATSGETTIKLPAARNRLNVVLPANSPKALYKLSVVDAFGRELLSRSAASADGKRLTTNIDMRALSASKYRLCVSLTAEAPDCYPFIVTHK